MNYKEAGRRIINLKNNDLELRDRLLQSGDLSEGYNKEMEAMHNKNALILEAIIDKIGYPSIDKVGKEASEAAWLIIQHAIAQPRFLKRCLNLLEYAVNENKADSKHLAYLTDRIAVFEDHAQLYGTQFDWDIAGQLSPSTFDDIQKVNRRREKIGLNSLEEQTEIIRNRIKNENQTPPVDFEERKHKFNEWRKAAGWIK
ncbi:hypothetical protein PQ462_10975 [Flavobacterium sp. KACC 22758]|uniref:DUF6624 domain-containing protein n=1 Tax=Flavobacterium sp. KACC 22758 TaxID=3025667 RepID=UPI0023663340|nr:DUF6624 domain-containing protein [Flavobacterium sp. KACC 22758]WDF61888.1 hypothetical protein PQ462_10975 [Flavobacterium sp. KACC 22758]